MNLDGFLGVVLCGGRSTRMGRDKGLIEKEDFVWSELVRINFTKLGIPSVVSINADQLESYSTHYRPSKLIVDCIDNCNGPMNGLLSIHRAFPDKHILLIATDMIEVNLEVISPLIDRFFSEKEQSSIAWSHEGFVQPMCAIYPSTVLQEAYTQLLSEEHINTPGLRYFFNQFPSFLLNLPTSLFFNLKNYNEQ